MSLELFRQQWRGQIAEVALGGGNRKSVTFGGAGTLPFFTVDGAMPNRPVIAMEIRDVAPTFPEPLAVALGDLVKDPIAWAKNCVQSGADLVCLRLAGANPDAGDASPEACAEVVKNVLQAVDVPLIILGCGDAEKDNKIFPAVCTAAEGARCLVGPVNKDNYRTIAAAAKVAGHAVIGQSPVDVNIQKQVAILLGEMDIGANDIVFDPTTGSLGYGLDYTYSVMERIRLAALGGEKQLTSPVMGFAGPEAWRAKEAGIVVGEANQGVVWEVITSTALLQAGSDLLVMLHPEAVQVIQRYITDMMGGAAA